VESPPAKVLLDTGDVMARARVRFMEMRASFDWLSGILGFLGRSPGKIPGG
jgi:hypothetical protein